MGLTYDPRSVIDCDGGELYRTEVADSNNERSPLLAGSPGPCGIA